VSRGERVALIVALVLIAAAVVAVIAVQVFGE
jgi:hypothetical protein